jgi:alpha-L-rhamnosidase
MLRVQSQASHVRALAFDLVPAHLRGAVAAQLAQLVRRNGSRLETGFLSTGMLLPTLADAGYPEVAYELLRQDQEPSWLTMIDRGATTVWERWNGVDADGVAHDSLNHYSKGAVASFLHRHVAGLRPTEPGYRRFQVRPMVCGGLTWARTELDSPYGRIEVRWQKADHTWQLDLLVPGGAGAQVMLPDGSEAPAGPGRHSFRGSSVLPGRADGPHHSD